MNKLLYFPLKIIAKLILARYRPKIIAVTGSVGKTSTKNAIYTILKPFFVTRRSYKSYNNQIGLPLTIIGFETPGKNIFSWLKIFIIGLMRVVYQKAYPQILVLEMGSDRVGDLDYLISIARPDISVISLIGSSHLEHFKTEDNLYREKITIVKKLKKNGTAILNFDDPKLKSLGLNVNKEVIFFGFDQAANFSASNLKMSKKGLNFKVNYQGNSVPVRVPVVGKFQVYNILAAFATGSALGLDFVQMAPVIENYQAEKGRARILEGIKNTTIIDDSYNSAPESVDYALEILDKIEISGRKVAILGDMLELGKVSDKKHKKIARKAAKIADILVFVGDKASLMREAIGDVEGLKSYSFKSEADLRRNILTIISNNDLILVKASQGVRLERVIKEILSKKLNPDDVLVRQSSEWGE
jgi:UDP-N-acetylmuramoyl-tripeptide--D-alanyl-D-alanine ligase